MKRTVIIYASNHGTTRKVAEKIAQNLKKNDVTLHNIGKDEKIDLSPFNQIIIGGSIHAGMIQRRLQTFIRKNMAILLEKPLGLFLCCMHEEEAQNQFNKAFPELLRHHAKSQQWVGGEFLFDNMNFIEKFMVKKIAGIKDSTSKLDEDKIDAFAEEMD